MSSDSFRNLNRGENALSPFPIDGLLMNDVLRIPPLGRDREALLSAKLGVGLQKAGLPIEDKWVAESRDLHLVPSLAKDYVALEYLVFECRAEASLRSPLFYGLLDLSPDPAHRAHLRPLELSNL